MMRKMNTYLIAGFILFLVIGLSAYAQGNKDTGAEAVSAASDSAGIPESAGTPAAAAAITRDSGTSGIFSRTTARSFSPEPVTEEQIDLLLRAAFASPTGGNQRSWEFIVVTDRKAMAVIQEGHPFAQALDTAPLLIIVAGNEQSARYRELLEFDSGIATQAILIQAAELGLSSVAMSIAPQEARIGAAARAADLPDYVVPHIMIAVGHPASDAVSSASVNFYSAQKVHRGKF
ncbi:nitroreductase family protein [Breznakiella homolactica]|uniref:Nitroreductase family protein n=1 Tax=Breznakiella homolactica TaxID=2798577 RepID=A0A7T7XJX3_9SPIR|nr:nitroreductase family protein [Breznakiella homolactica]QQO07779.1 nitroreductase family protein [Breznakiella homolactica]